MQIHESPDVSEIIKKIKADGLSKLHILADFDRTLTYGSYNGVKTPSLIALLRDGKHLTADYAEKANALYEKFAPLEQDPNIPKALKQKLMLEWWDTHNELLFASGLSLLDYEDIVNSGKITFREGVEDFLDFLNEHNIPLIIMSASACGDALSMFFKKINKDYANIHYVVNHYQWDAQGKAIATLGPVISPISKDEIILNEIPEIHQAINGRNNVILLGDSYDDVGMVTGFDYENLLKIGLLNTEYSQNREAFLKAFDVVLEGDGDLAYINKLLKEISHKN